MKQENGLSVGAGGPQGASHDEENSGDGEDTRAASGAHRLGTGADRSDLVRLAVQLIIEEVLEAEARDKLGRERYERVEGEPSGYRNGYRTGRLKTAEGSVRFSAPQLRDTAEPFVSAVRENLAGRTEA